MECKCNFRSVSVIQKGGTSRRRGGEIQISFTHPGNWSPKQCPITLLKLVPKTLKSVSVSVIKTEKLFQNNLRVRVFLVHPMVCHTPQAVLKCTENPFPRGTVGTENPEPLEPFHARTVTEPNRDHPVIRQDWEALNVHFANVHFCFYVWGPLWGVRARAVFTVGPDNYYIINSSGVQKCNVIFYYFLRGRGM